MKVLVACEYSGRVRDAFIAAGHDAISCDLLPTEQPGPHYQGDVLDLVDAGFDLIIAHPPCTYLSVSGMHWTTRGLRDPALTESALEFVRALMNAPIERIAIENPVSVISSRIRKPDQIIQPWQFGHDASKATCLWLKNLPPLRSTAVIKKHRYGNQTANGHNKLAPSPDRWKERSRTYLYIAAAMANQWGIRETKTQMDWLMNEEYMERTCRI